MNLLSFMCMVKDNKSQVLLIHFTQKSASLQLLLIYIEGLRQLYGICNGMDSMLIWLQYKDVINL